MGDGDRSRLNRMGGHDLLRAWLLTDLGAVFQSQGENEAALNLSLQALALKEKVLGNHHPDVASSERNLAIALTQLERYPEALSHVEKAVTIDREGLGSGHPDLATQLSNRGEILRLLGRHSEARASFEHARSIWERELGPDNLLLAYPLTGIGGVHRGDQREQRSGAARARIQDPAGTGARFCEPSRNVLRLRTGAVEFESRPRAGARSSGGSARRLRKSARAGETR